MTFVPLSSILWPQVTRIRFNYVFGSDEYLAWINSQYNDIFGFS